MILPQWQLRKHDLGSTLITASQISRSHSPHLLPPTSEMQGGNTLCSFYMHTHCYIHMYRHITWQIWEGKHAYTHAFHCVSWSKCICYNSKKKTNRAWMGGHDNPLSVLLHISSCWCEWYGAAALPVGSSPEEVFDVAVLLHPSILTAYCNTICSTSGLRQKKPAIVPLIVKTWRATHTRWSWK